MRAEYSNQFAQNKRLWRFDLSSKGCLSRERKDAPQNTAFFPAALTMFVPTRYTERFQSPADQQYITRKHPIWLTYYGWLKQERAGKNDSHVDAAKLRAWGAGES